MLFIRSFIVYSNVYLYEKLIIMTMVDFRNSKIGLMSRVFSNGPGDQGSIPG